MLLLFTTSLGTQHNAITSFLFQRNEEEEEVEEEEREKGEEAGLGMTKNEEVKAWIMTRVSSDHFFHHVVDVPSFLVIHQDEAFRIRPAIHPPPSKNWKDVPPLETDTVPTSSSCNRRQSIASKYDNFDLSTFESVSKTEIFKGEFSECRQEK